MGVSEMSVWGLFPYERFYVVVSGCVDGINLDLVNSNFKKEASIIILVRRRKLESYFVNPIPVMDKLTEKIKLTFPSLSIEYEAIAHQQNIENI